MQPYLVLISFLTGTEKERKKRYALKRSALKIKIFKLINSLNI